MTLQLKQWRVQKGLGLVATAATAVILWLLRRWRSRPRNTKIVPGHWLLGSLIDVVRAVQKSRHYEMSCQLHARHGQTFALKTIFVPWIVFTTNPKNIEHVLKTNFDSYVKGNWFRSRCEELLGRGIFNSDGHEWLQQRGVMSRVFTDALFKEHIWTVVKRNAKKLRTVLGTAEVGQPMDTFNLMNRFTLDTIGEIGFGKCIDSLGDPSTPFLKSFDRGQQIVFERFFSPIWRALRFFGIGSERETQVHMDRINTFTRKIVRELRDGMIRGSKKATGWQSGVAWDDIEARKSFVGLVLEDAQNRGEELSETHLRDLVVNFLIAGRDGTAQGLAWTVFCLTQNPEVTDEIRKEIAAVCGIRGPSYEDLDNLPFLHAVLSEALRLYPPFPNDPRVAASDDVWPDGTFIPRGSVVMCNNYSMGRDTLIWGEDADVFRPERWLERKEPPTSYEFAVFNAGPRECLGKRLAWIEMKTCLAMLLPTLSFELAVPADQITPDTQLTLGMAQGLPCFVSRDASSQARKSSMSSATFSDYTSTSEGPASEHSEGLVSEPDLESTDGGHDSSSVVSSDEPRKKRKSGWARQRRNKFWQKIRQLSPDRQFD